MMQRKTIAWTLLLVAIATIGAIGIGTTEHAFAETNPSTSNPHPFGEPTGNPHQSPTCSGNPHDQTLNSFGQCTGAQ